MPMFYSVNPAGTTMSGSDLSTLHTLIQASYPHADFSRFVASGGGQLVAKVSVPVIAGDDITGWTVVGQVLCADTDVAIYGRILGGHTS